MVEVEPDGMAATSGVSAGDIIVEINDRIVTDVDDIHRLLSTIPEGTPLRVTFIRSNEKRVAEIR